MSTTSCSLTAPADREILNFVLRWLNLHWHRKKVMRQQRRLLICRLPLSSAALNEHMPIPNLAGKDLVLFHSYRPRGKARQGWCLWNGKVEGQLSNRDRGGSTGCKNY